MFLCFLVSCVETAKAEIKKIGFLQDAIQQCNMLTAALCI